MLSPLLWWELRRDWLPAVTGAGEWLSYWRFTNQLLFWFYSDFQQIHNFQILSTKTDEPRHDKTNKMAVCQGKTQISLGIRPVWSVYAVCMKKAWVLSYPLSTERRLRSDWVDAQADPSLRWAHTHFVGFVMSRLRLLAFRLCWE